MTTCYAAGLRISEAIGLTVSAIDSERMVLRIVKGKGQKDRYVMLSPKLLAVLRAWWKVQRPRHWLFPGEHPEAPTTRSAVQLACRIASQRARPAKAVNVGVPIETPTGPVVERTSGSDVSQIPPDPSSHNDVVRPVLALPLQILVPSGKMSSVGQRP